MRFGLIVSMHMTIDTNASWLIYFLPNKAKVILLSISGVFSCGVTWFDFQHKLVRREPFVSHPSCGLILRSQTQTSHHFLLVIAMVWVPWSTWLKYFSKWEKWALVLEGIPPCHWYLNLIRVHDVWELFAQTSLNWNPENFQP